MIAPPHPTLTDVEAARERIRPYAHHTPLRRSAGLSEIAGTDVWLKLEVEQQTGSFKLRGAANTLTQLTDEERAAGVVAVSSGNHGRAVSYMARQLGVDATICISSRVPDVKVKAMRDLGAEVLISGSDQDGADANARRLVQEGRTFVHPFDDPRVISGQGTISLEVLEDRASVGRILVPLSGGGLAGGIAVAAVGKVPGIQVVGISQDLGPAMYDSIRVGELTDVVEEDSLADALVGGLGPVNNHSFHLCRTLLTDTLLVSENQIAVAMAWLYREEGLTVEGGGAVGVAALLAGIVSGGPETAVIVSGGNVGPETMERVLSG